MRGKRDGPRHWGWYTLPPFWVLVFWLLALLPGDSIAAVAPAALVGVVGTLACIAMAILMLSGPPTWTVRTRALVAAWNILAPVASFVVTMYCLA